MYESQVKHKIFLLIEEICGFGVCFFFFWECWSNLFIKPNKTELLLGRFLKKKHLILELLLLYIYFVQIVIPLLKSKKNYFIWNLPSNKFWYK